MLVGEVTQMLRVTSTGWTRLSKGLAHGRGAAVQGKTVPMVPGLLLARLR
jgi:hypothetical protein